MNKKLLIYIVAFNHEQFIKKVLDRIDEKIFEKYQTEILINDDYSDDDTLKIINEYKNKNLDKKCKITILSNPDNLGYGGNQKIGYHYAIKNQYDFVALVHGDGQYAPELLDDLIEDMSKKKADAVFGSRMLIKGGALKGSMPMYKFIGNKIGENRICSSLRETIDIFPTILDLLKIKKIILPGKSFSKFLINEQEKLDDKEFVFSETGALQGPYPSPKEPNIFCVKNSNFKLIFNKHNNEWQLYDLKEDPKENNNIIGLNSKIEKTLKNQLNSWMERESSG